MIEFCSQLRNRGSEMSDTTHAIGLEMERLISKPDDYRKAVEHKIGELKGVIHARFSKCVPEIVVIEYDPNKTTPYQIYKESRPLNGEVPRRGFLYVEPGLCVLSWLTPRDSDPLIPMP
jgi:hypothetical protein